MLSLIHISLPKPGDDTLGDSKFLGYFQLGTSTFQSSNNSTTGTEKDETLENAQFSDPLQSAGRDTDSEPEDNAHDAVYYAETVDFPDSPLHLKLLKKRSREAQGLDTEDDDEEESTTFSIMGKGHHHPHRSRKERPKTLISSNAKGSDSRRKITVNPDVLSSDVLKDDDQRSIDSFSNKSDALSPLDDLATPDDIDTPDDLDDDLFDSKNIHYSKIE
ncbi:UNVERIFIED_CONTAM: hypothetical protein NCL1_13315 [Trichonephila clavipes]